MDCIKKFTAVGIAVMWACSADAMEYKGQFGNHTFTIFASGEIVANEADRLQRFLDNEPHEGFRYEVLLDSPGGSLIGGLELGWKIRSLDFATRVQRYDASEDLIYPGECFSACALAFLGGERRTIDEDAAIGFHQFSGGLAIGDPQKAFNQAQSDAQILSTLVLKHIMEMGASAELFHKMNFARPSEMFIPDLRDLRDLDIITPTKFADFGFEPYKAGVVAFARLPEQVVGRDVIDQITVYCRKGVPHMLMSGPVGEGGLDPSFEVTVQEYLRGFEFSGGDGGSVAYPPEHIDFRAGETVRVEVKMDRAVLDILSSGGFSGSLSLPASTGFMFRFSAVTTENDREKIASALRHCIS